MVRTTGTKGINGSGFPGTAIAAVGFTVTTSVAAGGILHTPGPVIVITAITIGAMIAAMTGEMIAVMIGAMTTAIGIGIATKSHTV